MEIIERCVPDGYQELSNRTILVTMTLGTSKETAL